jgi:hypothetical protein
LSLNYQNQLEHDFYAGATAVFFEKGTKPVWKPSSLSEIDFDKDIERKYFTGHLDNPNYAHIWNNDDQFSEATIPYNGFALPTRNKVIDIFNKLNQDTQSTIDWFLAESSSKYGVKQKVQLVLEIHNKEFE